MLSTCFSSGSLEFWYILGQGYLYEQHSMKTLGIEALMSFLGREYFTYIARTHELVLCESTERRFWEAVLDSPRLHSMHFFPLLTLLCILSL